MEKVHLEDLAALAYELPDEVSKYKMSGDLAGARAAIGRWMDKPVGTGLKKRMQLEQMFLQQLPGQFPYTKEAAVEAFREKVPDFDGSDLDRLDRQGLAEWIWLDGEKHYVHNVVRNVLRKDREILERAGLQDDEAEERQILKNVILEEKTDGISVWHFRVRESIRLKDDEFYPGIFLRAHLPLPAKYHQVQEVRVISHDEAVRSIDPEDALARTICFEDTLQENREFFVEFEYTIKADYQDLFEDEDQPYGSGEWPAEKGFAPAGSLASETRLPSDGNLPADVKCFLAEQYPHIRFTPYLRALAAEIAGDEARPMEKARKIYDYITENVKYSFMREYLLMEDIPQYCARNLRGDCGVQALTFITLCRICGIPAKWQSGLYTHPRYIGAHDWAMFYTASHGWRYADLSFGGSAFEDGDEERRKFYFGNLDPFRMPANHAFQHAFFVPKRFMPIDPYDNQLGELESDRCGFGKDQVESSRELIEAKRV